MYAFLTTIFKVLLYFQNVLDRLCHKSEICQTNRMVNFRAPGVSLRFWAKKFCQPGQAIHMHTTCKSMYHTRSLTRAATVCTILNIVCLGQKVRQAAGNKRWISNLPRAAGQPLMSHSGVMTDCVQEIVSDQGPISVIILSCGITKI